MCAKAEDGTHTLMKGDEVVDMVEDISDCALLSILGK